MKKINVLFIILSIVTYSGFAQENQSFDFKSVQEMKRQHGFPDPFLKPDGSRVETKEDWEMQRQYIKAMLAHYQYGDMPPTPKNVVVKETLSEEIYDGIAQRKLYTLYDYRILCIIYKYFISY